MEFFPGGFFIIAVAFLESVQSGEGGGGSWWTDMEIFPDGFFHHSSGFLESVQSGERGNFNQSHGNHSAHRKPLTPCSGIVNSRFFLLSRTDDDDRKCHSINLPYQPYHTNNTNYARPSHNTNYAPVTF
jgi:hypothetical protein